MNQGVKDGAKSAAAIGQAGGMCLIILWAIWKIWGIDVPNDIAIAFTVTFSPIIHGLMTAFEARTGIDIVENGKSQTKEIP